MSRGDLTKPGPNEPAGMIERHDLRCRSCGAFGLEDTRSVRYEGDGFVVLGSFRFCCATYFRGKHGTCWNCASCEHWFDRVDPEPTGQLDLFAEAAA